MENMSELSINNPLSRTMERMALQSAEVGVVQEDRFKPDCDEEKWNRAVWCGEDWKSFSAEWVRSQFAIFPNPSFSRWGFDIPPKLGCS
jgi:hypothetical protein